jgi:hypothetical protein
MSKNDKRTGIWIPMELITDGNLDWTDKALYAEIMNLSKLEGGCHASNQHFGNLLGIIASAASKRISRLEKMEYLITNKLYDKNRCIGRIIQLATPKPTLLYRISQKNDANTYCSKETGSHKKHDMVPEGKNSSSETDIVVVPKVPNSDSQKNTNNTSINSKGILPVLVPDTGEVPVDVSSQIYLTTETVEDAETEYYTRTRDELYEDMNEMFLEEYPDWEDYLYNNGVDKFMQWCFSFPEPIEDDPTPFVRRTADEYYRIIRG